MDRTQPSAAPLFAPNRSIPGKCQRWPASGDADCEDCATCRAEGLRAPHDNPDWERAVDGIAEKIHAPRRSLLDLAPLELDCMNTLWPMGEGTVRDIRDRLACRLPRAYTTIMTIMDRLARKGVVERRKV